LWLGLQRLDDLTAMWKIITFPLAYSLPVGERFSFEAATAPFLSSLASAAGSRFTLNNVTDSMIRASCRIGDNRALFTFGVGIPNGKTKLNDDELNIAGIAANRPLDNPVTSFGAGLNANFGLALAQEFGAWVFGAGLGYSLRGKYEALIGAQEIRVQPGNEFNVTLGIDRDFEWPKGKAKFTADFIYTNYAEDDLAGQPFFEAGDKFLAQGRFLFPIAIFNPAIISAQNRWRLDNKSANAALLDNGNELEISAALFHPLSERFRLKYLLEAQIYSDTVDQTEGAVVFGAGAGLLYSLSAKTAIDPAVKFFKGRINTGPGSNIGITGWEFSGGLALRF